MQIRKNDSVMVIGGKERGKTGKVLRVLLEKDAADYRTAQYRETAYQAARAAAARRDRRERGRHSCLQCYVLVR